MVPCFRIPLADAISRSSLCLSDNIWALCNTLVCFSKTVEKERRIQEAFEMVYESDWILSMYWIAISVHGKDFLDSTKRIPMVCFYNFAHHTTH